MTKQVVVGFATLAAMTLLTALLAVYSVNDVVEMNGELIDYHTQNVVDARRMEAALERHVAEFRAHLLVQGTRSTKNAEAAREEFDQIGANLERRVRSPKGLALLREIEQTASAYQAAQADIVSLSSTTAIEQLSATIDTKLLPKHRALYEALEAFADHEQQLLQQRRSAISEKMTLVLRMLGVGAGAAVVIAAFFAVWLSRRLSTQIGTSIQDVRSSSTELEAAANEQAAGAREQSSAMSEISTTMTELLATSRQISQSAQRVADIASETEEAADAGGNRVREASTAVSQIRDQVSHIVEHMLELGTKSQRIGAILELIDELAEQTNILAINATIEAAGAGDSGRRFGVVAEEIRKLSDRVGGSTGEIRSLVGEIQEAVNTTVMATEGGAKAAEQGQSRFTELSEAFRKIAHLVETTTEAAQEIELSTTQQTSAVEQVNTAITDVAQAAREAETATAQTLQTATQLAELSDEMSRLIEASRDGAPE